MQAVVIFIILSSLLVIGKFLRVRVQFLQRLYLPSSVIGGLVGLAALSIFNHSATDIEIPSWTVDSMLAVPGFLINVIFATLFLGSAVPGIRKSSKSHCRNSASGS